MLFIQDGYDAHDEVNLEPGTVPAGFDNKHTLLDLAIGVLPCRAYVDDFHTDAVVVSDKRRDPREEVSLLIAFRYKADHRAWVHDNYS